MNKQPTDPKYTAANQAYWDERAEIHAGSKFYDLEGFLGGDSSLLPIETQELGDQVQGKTMLHLQCHFGLDTMSWARRGAIPTGIDFSEKAITLARDINGQLGLNCTFVSSNLYDLPENLTGQFDIVYTSYGVLAWLHDIQGWAHVIDHFLKPGGLFYMVEIHPFSMVLDDEIKDPELRVMYPYLHDPQPMMFEYPGSYASEATETKHNRQYEWNHSLSDILNALLSTGLQIEHFNEFDYTVFRQCHFMQQKGKFFHLPEGMPQVPLLFSLRAKKPHK